MSNKKCRQAIETRLSAWAAARSPALPVAWENKPYTPTVGSTFLRGYLLPADTTSDDLEGDHRAYTGLYQVSVHTPINTGPGAAEGIMDELATLFPVNLRVSVTGLTLQVITPVTTGPAGQDEAFYVLPVSFGYRADTI